VRRAAIVAVALALGLATGACQSSSTPEPIAASRPTTTSTSTTVAVASAPSAAPASVTRHDVTWVDTTRGTDADRSNGTPAKATRTLNVMTLEPDTPGRKPLVVFIHGVTASGPAYEAFLRPWAAAGYVVAAPTEPLTSGPGGWKNIGDYKNQPGDVRFVIDKMLATRPDVVDAEHVAVAGHSLGAITTIGSTLSSCCIDRRVDAAIEISGMQLPFPNGDFTHLPSVPFLLLHGAADNTVKVSGSDALYAKLPAPAHYLRFDSLGHVDILRSPLLHRTVLSFLARYLYGDRHALDGVPADVAATGGATWQQKV
jgi:dipeptidyl aminopeptidase/acylaminoacyl peptidase